MRYDYSIGDNRLQERLNINKIKRVFISAIGDYCSNYKIEIDSDNTHENFIIKNANDYMEIAFVEMED